MFSLGAKKHPYVRFATSTFDTILLNRCIRMMRTIVDSIDASASAQKAALQFIMDEADIMLCADAPRHHRLIRDDQNWYIILVEQSNGFRRTWQKSQLLDFAHEFNLLNNCPVSIEEGRPLSPG